MGLCEESIWFRGPSVAHQNDGRTPITRLDMELHEQLTPTKVYSAYKTRTLTLNDVTCRLCGNPQKFWHMYGQVAQALLRQSTWKDTTLHWRCYSLRCLNNTGSLILFSIAYKYRPQATKRVTWSRCLLPSAGVYRPYVCRANRVDARFVDQRAKKVLMVEMSALGWTTVQRNKQRKPTSMGP